MKFLIALASLALTYAYDISGSISRCSCSNVNYQNDCTSLNSCQWTGSACQTTNCSSITSYSSCSSVNICAWVNSTCSTFTKCSDYMGTANATCLDQGPGCSLSNSSNMTSACTDYVSTGTTTTLAYCSTYTTNATCLGTGYNCVWTGTACRVTACSDMTSSLTCTRTNSDDIKTIKVCAWSTACAEASSLSGLTASTCFSYTSGRATWNSATNVCSQCSSSHSFLLLISLLSVLLL